MKVEIMGRFSREVIFAAEIPDGERMSPGRRLGLAAEMAAKAGVSLRFANLRFADLRGANLRDAGLRDAGLWDADLCGADLAGVLLAGANLTRANLWGVTGLNYWIKCIQVEKWPITYTAEVIQIGCQQHSIEAWRNFSDDEIAAMDSDALAFWRKWKAWIFQAIELAPATPTNPVVSQ